MSGAAALSDSIETPEPAPPAEQGKRGLYWQPGECGRCKKDMPIPRAVSAKYCEPCRPIVRAEQEAEYSRKQRRDHRSQTDTLALLRKRKRAGAAGVEEADGYPTEAEGYHARDIKRPRTYGDCLPGGVNEERPCPWVSCRYHLQYDVKASGSIKVYRPDLALEDLPATCALDVAGAGESTLVEIGALLNLSREAVRQIVETAIERKGGHFDDPD